MSAGKTEKKAFLTDRESEVLAKSWLCMKEAPDVRTNSGQARPLLTSILISTNSPMPAPPPKILFT